MPGRTVYLHPLHNFAVIAYDPDSVGDTPVTEVTLADEDAGEGDRLWLVGLNRDHVVAHTRTEVERVEPVLLEDAISRALELKKGKEEEKLSMDDRGHMRVQGGDELVCMEKVVSVGIGMESSGWSFELASARGAAARPPEQERRRHHLGAAAEKIGGASEV